MTRFGKWAKKKKRKLLPSKLPKIPLILTKPKGGFFIDNFYCYGYSVKAGNEQGGTLGAGRQYAKVLRPLKKVEELGWNLSRRETQDLPKVFFY